MECKGILVYIVDYSLQKPHLILWGISWSTPLRSPSQVAAGLAVSSLGSDLLERRTTLWRWTLGATVSFHEVTWDSRLIVPLGVLFRRVLVGDVTTSETDVLFWYLTHLSILSLLVCTRGLESSCHKLHLAISPSILHRFSRSQWLRKALEKTFR